jgi:hypothetical protein
MTQARQRFQSFAEYLSYDDGTDHWYGKSALLAEAASQQQ